MPRIILASDHEDGKKTASFILTGLDVAGKYTLFSTLNGIDRCPASFSAVSDDSAISLVEDSIAMILTDHNFA